MRPRGTALLIAMVCVFLVSIVAALLARSGAARIQARRADVEQEATLRRAESALEIARLAVERGRLKAGGTVEAEGLTVTCAASPGGVVLSAAVEMPLPPGASLSSLRRKLHVKRTLIWSGPRTQASGWEMDWETVVAQPAGGGRG